MASRQSPDVVFARLEQRHSELDIDVAKDPFTPKFTARSDGVYTSGYPNNIYGHSPSLLSAQIDMSLYDRPRKYELAATGQDVSSFSLGSQKKIDEVAYRIAELFLDAKRFGEDAAIVKKEIPSWQSAVSVQQSLVGEGSALPVDLKRAQVGLAQVRARLLSFEADQAYSESLIAAALGFPAGDRVRPLEPGSEIPSITQSEKEAMDTALANNKDILRLQASLFARRMEINGYKSNRLPQVTLVAQYSLIQKSTYQDYFASGSVQRNNGQLGAAFVLPILIGPSPRARLDQTNADYSKLQIELDKTRNDVIAGTHRGYQEREKAREAVAVTHRQLALADDEISVVRSLTKEGRAADVDLERAKMAGLEKQIAVEEAENQLQRANLDVLRQLGNLMSALQTQ